MSSGTMVKAVVAAPRTVAAREILERLRAFALPGGEEAARRIRGVRITQRGEIRSAPTARWIRFTAQQTIDAVRSAFRWEAQVRLGPLPVITVTDAYEGGHGWMAIKLARLVPLGRSAGPAFDQGEMQRYLSETMACPPSFLNHSSLEWTLAGPGALRLRDREDPTGASVDVEIGADGRPLTCYALRPRTIGKAIVVTPWSGAYDDPKEWDGLRVPARLEAAWHLPEGAFTYFRGETTSLVALRWGPRPRPGDGWASRSGSCGPAPRPRASASSSPACRSPAG